MSPTIPGPANGVTGDAARFGVAAAVAVLVTVLGYAALATPGAWFPRQEAAAWNARQLALVRGTGGLVGEELVVTTAGPDGTVLISLDSDLRSDQYPAIAWAAIDVPEGADLRLLWRSDIAPARVYSVRIPVESGRPLPVLLAGNPAWVGRVKGLALFVGTRLDRPLHVRGVVAKPMGAPDVLGDRMREWFAFEAWTGESVNEITGGADLQDLPLPLFAAVAGTLAVALWMLSTRLSRRPLAWLPFAVVAAFAAGTALLDGRFTWNLARQAAEASARYGDLDLREKHLAAEDGALFAFVEKARERLPATPARVFVAAGAHYLRSRAAYHLYPHNVFHDPGRDTMPRADLLRPGDWLLVYQRPGVQYDAATRRLRWDGGPPVPARLELAGDGAALFRIDAASATP
ncbi:MAG: hypothetical protein ABIR52_00515 [Casimicrobiaceae bacterium]